MIYRIICSTGRANNLPIYLESTPGYVSDRQIETAKKAGYVQGVCECAAIAGAYREPLGKKLLSEMKVTKAMAKEYAKPETYKALEQGIFAPRRELQQFRGRGL